MLEPRLAAALGLVISCAFAASARTPIGQESRAHDSSAGQQSTPLPRIRGRVIGRDSVPAAGLELLIRPANLDLADGRQTYDNKEFRLRTDLEGAFEVGGLERDVGYIVRARVVVDQREMTRYFTHLLTAEPLLPQLHEGDPESVLHFSRPYIVVRLLDEEGRPWHGPEALPQESDEELRSEWRAVPETFLYDSVSCGEEPCALGLSRDGERIALGANVYEIPANARYLPGAYGGPFDGSVQLVDVPEGADRILVELRARRMDDLGTVSVRVLDHGKELGVNGSDALFTVVLQSPLGGVAFLADGPYRHGSPFVFRAPPGTYRVVARGYASIEGYHGGLVRARDLGQATAAITLESGAAREVELELDTGGRLELSLEGQGNDIEFDSMPTALGSERSVHVVELLLVGPAGHAEGILCRWPGLYQSNLRDLWPLGETRLSECLPTGRATILARQKSGKETRVEVELREGDTTRVKLSF